jgi:tetratricopeptide (TPR) repeat protein
MNYYEIVGVAASASTAEIEQKIKEEYRKNQRRVNNADQAKRQAAERRAAQLMEAKRILLDAVERKAHDLRLAATPASGSPSPVVTSDWLTEGETRLGSGDFHGALYCANEARRVLGDNVAAAWLLMSQANISLGNAQQALFEAQRAVSLEPGNPDNHFTLGLVYEELEQWDAAIRSFETVRQYDPSAENASLEIANVLLRSGRVMAGIQSLEQLYASSANREFIGDALGFALVGAAELVPACREGEQYSVTTPVEIMQMRQYLSRARQVAADPEVHEQINQTEAYLAACEVKRIPKGSWIRSANMVKLSLAVGAVVLLCLCGGVATDGGIAAGTFILFVLLGYGGILALIYAVTLEPQWKTNLKVWQYEQRQRGR